MRKFAVCFCVLFLVPVFVAKSHAQEAAKAPATGQVSTSDQAPARGQAPAPDRAAAEPAHFYQLHFVLEELDAAGKPINSRSFTTAVSTAGSPASIVTGSKIPIITGPGQSEGGKRDSFQTEFQYIDVGVKITTRDVRDAGSSLSFNLTAEVSSLAAPETLDGVQEPVIRQNVWNGSVMIPVGKAATVFKSDSFDTTGSMQLVATATPLE